MKNLNMEKVAQWVFYFCLVFIVVAGSFLYGAFAFRGGYWPIPQMKSMLAAYREFRNPDGGMLRKDTGYDVSSVPEIINADALQPGLVLVAGISEGRNTGVKVMERDGTIVQEWDVNWSEIWGPTEGNFPEQRRPKTGMYLHGMDLLPTGDLVANFEALSTIRMDVCGDLVWKLDNLGHHSVHYDPADNTLWVNAEDYIEEGPTGYPLHKAPLRSDSIQQLDLDGNLLRDIPIIDIFLKNDLAGMLYMSNLSWMSRGPGDYVSGDTMHLNNVETFPTGVESETFAPGDLLMSIRNINTVMVVDPETLEIKFISTGPVVRQHDSDFLGGDVISIFDNANQTDDPRFGKAASRIVEIDARTGEHSVALDGAGKTPFYSDVMATHERLPNGNILVNESMWGRILEFTPEGELVYSYTNAIGPREIGRTFEAQVLPESMDKAFFETARAACTQ